MAKKTTNKQEEVQIHVPKLMPGQVTMAVLGRTPLICNRLSEKAKHELLFPAKRTAADKSRTLKHDPLAEFRASPYTNSDPAADTYIEGLASWFRGALKSAALDIPGITKSAIGRLTWIEKDRISIYGLPQLFMATVRQAGINKTPDIRTRTIIPEWACFVTFRFVMPQLSADAVANLFAAAGMTQGVGDWRNEKGSGSYGSFDIVPATDKAFKRIIKEGGREAQLAAMQEPMFYDDETAELFTWFESEVEARGKTNQLVADRGLDEEEDEADEADVPPKNGRSRKNGRAVTASA